jgi:hypothetical protein
MVSRLISKKWSSYPLMECWYGAWQEENRIAGIGQGFSAGTRHSGTNRYLKALEKSCALADRINLTISPENSRSRGHATALRHAGYRNSKLTN